MKVSLKKGKSFEKMPKDEITGSKSESNRLLILKAIYPNLILENLSESDDTEVLKKGLKVNSGTIDIGHAGTAMRFLTAYFASQTGKKIQLTGSERMKQRPIAVLVEALRSLGAEITYLGEEGFPPLSIVGKELVKKNVTVEATVSSQYISALMLIAPSLPNGLTIYLEGKATSVPYIKMTLSLLKKIGVLCHFSGNKIEIQPLKKIKDTTITVESDWSSASYFYSLVALSEDLSVTLKSFREGSLQGDSELVSIFRPFGVSTTFNSLETSLTLSKGNLELPKHMELHLVNTPDIAQTLAVTCFGLKISCKLTGLHTLKIKETDRLLALKTELEKLGAEVRIGKDSLELFPSKEIKEHIAVDTYNDHRMAMAFAPLALKTPLQINDPKVVSKSFPAFWSSLQKMGIVLNYQ